jgi:hypothetical protein
MFPDLPCRAIMQHKSISFHPDLLTQHGIKYEIFEQKEGDTLILGNETYHQGWSYGQTQCVAINFTLSDWILGEPSALKVSYVNNYRHFINVVRWLSFDVGAILNIVYFSVTVMIG